MHAPFVDNPNPLRLGIRPVPADRWLETTAFAKELADFKKRALVDERDTVLRHSGENFSACWELLAAVEAATGQSGVDTEPDPIACATLMIEEDLCLIEEAGDGHWRFTHGCVCLPTQWLLSDKIGDTMDGVHGPVPLLNERLAAQINRFFLRLRPDKIYERFNWSLVSDPAWALKPRDRRIRVPAEERDWARIERQTFRKLPDTAAVVFTIGIHRYRIAEFDTPARAALKRAAEALPPPLSRYKGFTDQSPAT